ncbi:MAG TPA: hypothetical protein VF116_08805 [Ktedonobacterales bacterium]
MRAPTCCPAHLPQRPRPRSACAPRLWRAPVALAAGVLLALLALLVALAGCGITTTTTNGAAGSAPNTTATATASAIASSHINPCPGPVGSVGDAGTPVLVLTPQSANHSGSAHAGALVQVRLPDASHWDYLSTASLAPLSPAGVHDTTLGVCVWNFRPQSAGAATLSFARSAICQPRVPCPLYVQRVSFTLDVTA